MLMVLHHAHAWMDGCLGALAAVTPPPPSPPPKRQQQWLGALLGYNGQHATCSTITGQGKAA